MSLGTGSQSLRQASWPVAAREAVACPASHRSETADPAVPAQQEFVDVMAVIGYAVQTLAVPRSLQF